EGRVVASTADHRVVSVAAQQLVLALAADDGVVACAAVDHEADDVCRQTGGVDRVAAATGTDREDVSGLSIADVDLRGQPYHLHTGAGTGDGDLVVAVGAVDDHLIDGAVAAAAARAKVDGNLLDVGGGKIVDRDVVGAAQGPELDLLHIVEVHDHVAD